MGEPRGGGGVRASSRCERTLKLVEARADGRELRFHVGQLQLAAAIAGKQRVGALQVFVGDRAQDVGEFACVDVWLDGAKELDERRLAANQLEHRALNG